MKRSEQLAFTMLEVKDPYYHQGSRINAHKRETLDKHMNSENGKRQLERVFDFYLGNPTGLTDREISDLYEFTHDTRCNPSTVSARRHDIEDGRVEGFTIQPLIVDGEPFKRNGGIVHCLVSK
jgi:hypothetical protein